MEQRPSRKQLLSLLSQFRRKRVLVLGDLMLDHFIRGRVRRISPEAPVPVVAVSQESHAPGGAGNVCSNLTALCARVFVFGVVGADEAGRALLADLRERGSDVGGVAAEPGRVTTQKVRVVAEHQQVVRYDRETPRPLSPATQNLLLERLDPAIRSSDAVILSDYGKGILTPHTLKRVLGAARRARVPVVVDPKVEHFKRYRGVDCITPNTQEAWGGMRAIPSPSEEALVALGRKILRALKVRALLITRGEKGMSVFCGASVRHIPTKAKEVFDVTGAGDTVTSVMALALACRAEPYCAAYLANLAAGIVVGKLGTATASSEELEAAVRENA